MIYHESQVSSNMIIFNTMSDTNECTFLTISPFGIDVNISKITYWLPLSLSSHDHIWSGIDVTPPYFDFVLLGYLSPFEINEKESFLCEYLTCCSLYMLPLS